MLWLRKFSIQRLSRCELDLHPCHDIFLTSHGLAREDHVVGCVWTEHTVSKISRHLHIIGPVSMVSKFVLNKTPIKSIIYMSLTFQTRTSICAAVKVYYVPRVAQRNDFTWGTFDIFTWATAEFFFMVVCGTAPTMKPLLDFIRHRLGHSAWSSNNADTGDSGAATDGLELNGYRRDVSRTHTVISNSPHKERAKSADADMRDHVAVGKTYKIRVERGDGDQNSSFVEESRGFERRISAQAMGTDTIKST